MPPALDRPTGPFDLSETPIHLGSVVDAENPAVPLSGFGFDVPAFEAYIAEHCAPGAPGHLIMVESTPADWGTWECHTEGDEVVIVLEGRADFIQEIDGEPRRVAVGPGSTTPCPGTQHRPR